MSLKQFYTDESQIPAELKDFYRKSGERYEIQIDGVNSISAVLDKNTELLKEKADLKRERDDAVSAKESAEAERDNYKTNPKLPKGQRLVSIEDAELIEAVKSAELTKETVGELKTRAETAERELATMKTDLVNDKVSIAAGKDKTAWLEHSRSNNLRFDTRKEKAEGDTEEKDVFFVLTKDADGKDVEIKLDDYVSTKATHVKDADVSQQKKGIQFPAQKTALGKVSEGGEAAEQARAAQARTMQNQF